MQNHSIVKIKNIMKKNKGFTLIELLVALAVLVIAAAVFVPALTFVTKANQSNYTKMVAGKIATSVIEEIRAMHYDEIGTVGGNPSGMIPQASSVTVDGTDYQVETRIAWGSAESTVSGTTVDTALKKIRVIVKAPGAFSGVVEEAGEINSLVSRESEEIFQTSGHIQVYVKNSEATAYKDSSIEISLTSISPTPALSQSMRTDSDGRVLFGFVDAGNYIVKAKLPYGVTPGFGQTVEDGWIVVDNVPVNDYQTTEVIIYMDKEASFSKLSVKLVKEGDEDGSPIIADGTLSLNWQNADINSNVIENRSFAISDFVDDMLPQSFFGSLWSTGVYSLRILDVAGYANYDMSFSSSAKPLLPDGTEWDGTLLPDQALELRVPLKEGVVTVNFYKEDTRADFEDAALLDNLVAIDQGNGALVLEGSNTELDLIPLVERGGIRASKTAKDYSVENICDGDNDTYWQAGDNSMPQWVQWDFGDDARVVVTGVGILANEWKIDTNDSRVPKRFRLQCSQNGTDWTDVLDSTTLQNYSSNIQQFSVARPQPARYFRLYITDRYHKRVAINEIKLYSDNSYVSSGTRISQGKQFDNRPEFASAPQFRISWEAYTDADTSVRVYTAITDNNVMPSESRFVEAVNGGYISNIVTGSDIRGKFLWVMEKLETNDATKTPSLDWLSIDY